MTQAYTITSPILKDGQLYTRGILTLTADEAEPLIKVGAIAVAETPATESGSQAPDQLNPNRISVPTDAAERITHIKAAITQMEANKQEADWTQNSGPKLKPLAEAVGFEVSVEERNQAYAELHPAPAQE